MTAIAQRKAILNKQAKMKRYSPKEWNSTKHRWYWWGRNQCMKKKLRDPVMHLLEIIINCCNLKKLSQATNDKLLELYNKKHPNHPISRASLYRHLSTLEKHKLIKRYEQQKFYSPGIIRLLAPKSANLCVSKCDTNNLLPNKLPNNVEASPCESLLHDSKYDERFKTLQETLKKMLC